MSILVCGCSNESEDKTPIDSENTPTVNGSDDPVGEVVQREPDSPEVTKFVTFTLPNSIFPTYLSSLVGTKDSHLFQSITIKNPSKSRQTVVLTGSLAGYTKTPAVSTVNLDPGEERSGWFDAALDFDALNKVAAPVAASFDLKLTTQEGKVLFASTKPTTILPKNTVFWKGVFNDSKPSALGAGLRELQTVATLLTTPHDGWGEIDKLLHEAATHAKNNQMSGYAGYHTANTTFEQDAEGPADQVGAIYAAHKTRGFNYTNVPRDFFSSVSQNVRYPAEALRATTGNCIDGTLIFPPRSRQ